MHKAELVAKVAESAGITKAQAQETLNAVTDSITDALSNGDTVSLIGFGSFSVRQRSERKGKNPQTGAEITIPASKSVGFKAGKALKESVN